MTRAFRLLLVAALALAAQAALVHPLEHRDAAGALVHAGAAHADQAQDERAPDDAPTLLCDLLAALGAGAIAQAHAGSVSVDVDDARPRVRPRAPRPVDPPVFRAQAPPVVL